jgi:hypothetical protein
MDIDEEVAEQAGDLVYSLIEALDGINVEVVVAALAEVLALAPMQME